MTGHGRCWYWPPFEVRRTILGLLVLGLIGYTVWQVNSVTSCQAEFNTRTNTVINDRSGSTDLWMSSQLAYLDIAAEPSRTQAERLAALNEYRAGLRAALQARKSAPLPEEPRCD